jgi:two-component system C4-dicarboxylate transport response regulator DctD
LLVDDEHDITYAAKKGLELQNFDVTAYNDPHEVIENYEEKSYDFHVFDIRMPGMSGFDLARQIWQKDPDAQVCFLSAFEIYQDEANKVFKNLNTTCFIKKPVTAKQLVEHLQMHMAGTQ